MKHRQFVFPNCFAAAAALLALALSPTECGAVNIQIVSDAADGSLEEDLTPGTLTTEAGLSGVRIGVAGSSVESTRYRANAIFFFELPSDPGASLIDANFDFQYIDRAGDDPQLFWNADLWGLGYVSSAALDTDWLLFGNTDGDAGLGIASRVRIQDNILTPSTADPGGTAVAFSTDAGGDASLVSFVSSLYAAGASAGDFAVLRLNPDVAMDPDVGGTPGYFVGFNEYAPGNPVLTLTVPEPGRALLAALGLAGLFLRRRRG